MPASLSIDQPLLGITANRVVVQANTFVGSLDTFSATVTSSIYSIDKADLLAGEDGKLVSWVASGMGMSTAPALNWDPDVDDAYLITSWDNWDLRLMRISGPLGQDLLQTVAKWPLAVAGTLSSGSVNLGKQKGTKVAIDTGDGRVHDAILRSGSIWFAFSVITKLPGVASHSSVMWQQVKTDGTLIQSALVDVGESLTHPSLAVDAKGNVLIGCTRMNANSFASAAFLYHRAGTAPGVTQPVRSWMSGEGTYDFQVEPWGNRWGDYSATVVDPLSDHLWTAQEYALAPGLDVGRWGVAWAEISPEDGACATNANCHPLLHCEQGTCLPDLLLGEACATAGQCGTDHCAGGVCCDAACEGACQICIGVSEAAGNTVGYSAGECVFAPSGTPCDDGSACTDKSVCKGSKCSAEGPGCDDANPCTTDVCDPKVGCSHQSHQGKCSDGDPCTAPDLCLDGACSSGGLKVCVPDPALCQLGGVCNPNGDCAFETAVDGAHCPGGSCREGECAPDPAASKVGGCGAGLASPGAGPWLALWVLGLLQLRRRSAKKVHMEALAFQD